MSLYKKITITDDSGFLAIVNTSLYTSFVDEDWELTELFNHFISEMNKHSIIVWSTGSEQEWTIAVTDKASSKQAFRQFTQTLSVTNEKLYLTNYEDLTTAAQFEEAKLPVRHNSDSFINLDNGLYNVTVRQMFDPEDDETFEESISFEIIVHQTNDATEPVTQIHWLTE